MCGFAGIFKEAAADNLSFQLQEAANQIEHRGPDDEEIWLCDRQAGGLAFRRLAIQDLSPAGRQPMQTADQRFVMVFNGEIYNHLKLRQKLPIPQGGWKGHSDSETVLQAFLEWGVERSLNAFEGMFAIALWDQSERKLHLIRDRFGEKPLYYHMDQSGVAFASELKALLPLIGKNRGLAKDSLAAFFRFRYIPAPKTIYQDVFKLRAGEHITFDFTGDGVQKDTRIYWNCRERALSAQGSMFDGSQEEALNKIEEILLEAMEGRLLSDVPLGAFLSGGIDSSLSVALAQKVSAAKIKSYTIRFEDPRFDESKYARMVADHLATDHHEITVTAEDALALINDIPNVYDEPFADPSQLPTMLICKKAKEHVTVALSGDGGDEFFAGYSRYDRITRKWSVQKEAPFKTAMAGLACLPWQYLGARGLKLKRKIRNRSARSLKELAQFEVGFWRDGVPVRDWNKGATGFFTDLWSDMETGSDLMRQMVMDADCYLPEDLQVKTDRAAMAHSLEVRTPFLNQDLAEFCWHLPDRLLWPEGGDSKNLLRELAYRHVPKNILDRPKQGFDVPVRDWLRGPLREWGEMLISAPGPAAEAHLDMAVIRKRWDWHQGGAHFEGDLWPALVLISWMKRWLD